MTWAGQVARSGLIGGNCSLGSSIASVPAALTFQIAVGQGKVNQSGWAGRFGRVDHDVVWLHVAVGAQPRMQVGQGLHSKVVCSWSGCSMPGDLQCAACCSLKDQGLLMHLRHGSGSLQALSMSTYRCMVTNPFAARKPYLSHLEANKLGMIQGE